MSMSQTKWFDRKFDFGSNQNIFPSIIERLRGAPARLEEKMKSVPEELLSKKIDNTWSIKENIGHLIDLEPLWQGRLEDILGGAKMLRSTDLANRETDEADHNQKGLRQLLAGFRDIRSRTVQAMERLSEKEIFMSALHPRLRTPMRTMDHFQFVADHDDHHLARIHELLNLLKHEMSKSLR